MTVTATCKATIAAPTASALAVKSLQFWLASENVVLADGGSPGTEIVWNAGGQRIEFWIYGILVTSIEAHVPIAGGEFRTNGLLDTIGRVYELDPDDWQTRTQSLPLEFDSLVGAWCVATYPGGETAMWVHANGNIRLKEVYEFPPQVRYLTGIWDAFGGLLHLSAEGVLTVERVTETLVIYPVDAWMPSMSAQGVARRVSRADGDATLPAPTSASGARRVTHMAGGGAMPGLSAIAAARRYVVAVGDATMPGLSAGSAARRVASAIGDAGLPGLSSDTAARAVVSVTGDGEMPTLGGDAAARRSAPVVGDAAIDATMESTGAARRVGVAVGDAIIVTSLAASAQARRIGVAIAVATIAIDPVANATARRAGPVTGAASIASPTGGATSRRIGVATGDAIVPAPTAASVGRRLSYTVAAAVMPDMESLARLYNPSVETYQIYRVAAIQRDPRGPYQRLTLEALERPIDR